MNIIKEKQTRAYGIKIQAREGEKILGRAYVYILWNDVHEEPFALLEDVFVKEDVRHKGYGTKIVKEALELAKKTGCYKIIATTRDSKPAVQAWYQRLGFHRHAAGFRKDF